jgi:excinuclease ABC subunit C
MAEPLEDGAEAAVPPPVDGITVVEAHLKTLPNAPGVYRMINAKGDVIYVGKAKSLKKRVASYASAARLSIRLRRMVAETASMEFVTTHTEAEALLLEANLIKRYVPRYNILLRDDKSFPSILLTRDHPFPQVVKHRGARSRKGDYFGPFASAWAVNQTLTSLERAFLLRSCSDSVFANRTRPCLLHQIKRCSAPCAGRIGQEDYSALVEQAHAFLTGGSQGIQRQLSVAMEEASGRLDYEKAAQFRDRIRALAAVQAHQNINIQGIEDADVIACHKDAGQSCVQVFFFRAGCNYGSRAYFPSHVTEDEAPQILEAFLTQFYDNKQPPKLILLSHELENQDLVTEALSVKAGQKVTLTKPSRGNKAELVQHALVNAREALGRRVASSASQRRLLEDLQHLLDLEAPPERIEVFDNSHISGSQPVGAMIVAGPEGMMKGAYRKFSIRGQERKPEEGEALAPITTADDYAMMREVLTRRYSRALKEDPDRSRGQWPDLILIDGGQGQLGIAQEVFADLGIDDITVAAIAKGPDRDAGREKIFLPGRDEPIQLDPKTPVLHFLQRLRDEAHRFVIGAHRDKRSKGIVKSALDAIPGIGAKRKKALLHHFGSAAAVERAGAADLAAVEGISHGTAKKIYDWFHPEG